MVAGIGNPHVPSTVYGESSSYSIEQEIQEQRAVVWGIFPIAAVDTI